MFKTEPSLVSIFLILDIYGSHYLTGTFTSREPFTFYESSSSKTPLCSCLRPKRENENSSNLEKQINEMEMKRNMHPFYQIQKFSNLSLRTIKLSWSRSMLLFFYYICGHEFYCWQHCNARYCKLVLIFDHFPCGKSEREKGEVFSKKTIFAWKLVISATKP